MYVKGVSAALFTLKQSDKLSLCNEKKRDCKTMFFCLVWLPQFTDVTPKLEIIHQDSILVNDFQFWCYISKLSCS